MSYIEKILGGIKVEWKNFGEVAKIQRGASPRPIAKFITEDMNGIPWIRIGDTYPNSKYVANTKQKITLEGAKKSRILKKGDFIISNSMSFGRPYILDIAGAIHDGWASISDFEDKLDSNYLYHYLACESVQNFWLSKINSGSVSNLNADIIKSLPIPIPPFEVQRKIAHILDILTERTTMLVNELEAELIARNKQYKHFRDKFFRFEGRDVEWKTLSEIGEFQRGKRFVRTDMISEGVPCIHYGEMYTHYNTWADESRSFLSEELVENRKLRVAEKGDVVIVAAGETIEDLGKGTAWLCDRGVVIHDACFSYRSSLNPKYVAYYTRTKLFHDQIKKHISSGKISAIHSKGLGKVLIPVASPEEQQRIVTVLDRLDILTASITEELPREIDQRRKQYEYYRDLLMTFPKGNLMA